MKKSTIFLISIIAVLLVITIIILFNGTNIKKKNDIVDINFTVNNIEMNVGDTLTLQLKNNIEDNIIFKSSNPDIVTVDEKTGLVNANESGSSTITVYLVNNNDIKDECIITVLPKEEMKEEITSISLNNNSVELEIGESKILEYELLPTDTENKKVSWSISDTKVASINIFGVVKGLNVGNAVVTIKSENGITDTCNITVTNKQTSGTPTVEKYILTYFANDGSVYPSGKTLNKGDSYGTLPTPIRSGYTFDGWFTSKDGGNKVNESTIISSNTTIYAHWTKNTTTNPTVTYTLTFNPNGGSVTPTSKTLNKGDSYGTLPTPTRSGYTFNGWYTSASGGNKVSATTIINANTTIYAHWTKNTTEPEKTAKIHFLHVGDADAIVLEVDGHFGLMDAGYNYDSIKGKHPDVVNPVNYIKSIGATHLDFIIASHVHEDHIGGMASIVSSSLVNSNTKFYYRSPISEVQLLNEVKTILNNKGAKSYDVANNSSARSFKLGTDSNYFKIDIMNTNAPTSDEGTANENKNSIIAYVTHNGAHGTLLTGDLESQDEYRIANNNELSGKQIEVIKIAHHGWQSSTTMKFVKMSVIKPKIAIITNSRVLDDISTAIYYLQQKHNTKFYLTGNSPKAIVVEYGNTLTVKNDAGSTISSIANYTATNTGDGWKKLQNGIVFYQKGSTLDTIAFNEFIKYNNNWYYFNIGGNMMTGWIETKYDGVVNYYYMGEDGKMITGWCQAKSISPFNNNISTNGSYYRYNKFMYSHEAGTINGGWYEYDNTWANGSHWFYFDSSGAMVSNKTINIDGISYTFDRNGICVSSGC